MPPIPPLAFRTLNWVFSPSPCTGSDQAISASYPLIMQDEPQIQFLRVEDLTPYELNNKIHGEKEINRIANSINEFGFTVPILVDEHLTILAGHKRLAASKKLGLETVPVIVKEGLTESQKKAYRIIDNKATQESEWNFNNLELELKTLDELQFDITPFVNCDWNFVDSTELAEIEECEPGNFLESNFKRGDVVTLDDHILVCGDATNQSDMRRLLLKESADLLVTDPPYNVDYTGKTKQALKIQNDQMDADSFLEFLSAALLNASLSLKPGAAYYIFHADLEGLRFRIAVENAGLLLKQTIIWNKNALVMGRQDYQSKHEPILYGWKDGGAHYFVDDRTQTTVWDFDKHSRNAEHPTMKPVALVARCIANSTKKGGIVLDPFAGSGSTLIASVELGRTFRGMEIDPKYVQVIVNRYISLKESRGESFDIRVDGEPYYGA